MTKKRTKTLTKATTATVKTSFNSIKISRVFIDFKQFFKFFHTTYVNNYVISTCEPRMRDDSEPFSDAVCFNFK